MVFVFFAWETAGGNRLKCVKKIFAILFLTFATFEKNFAVGARTCWHANDFSLHLSTKTAYRFVSNQDDSVLRYDGCEAKKLWMVVRHGSRYPGKKIITSMRTKLTELRDAIIFNQKLPGAELCPGNLLNLSSWSPAVQTLDNKRLVHEGEDEMIELAERFQNRLPEILPKDYTNSTYKFKFTATQRTMESKRYFTIGLFGRKVSRYVWAPAPLSKDPILRFYKLCPKWINEVDKNPNSLKERIKFEESDYMKNVINNVSKRLGFKKDLPLEDIHLIYVTCGFESAWNPYHPSPWCNLFTKEEFEVLEYAEDLEYYWIDGYGYRINYEQACPILNDMLHHLTSESEPTSTFYFTHSGTLLKLLSHLGLYKDDEKLTHKTFEMERLWRVGKIDAFGTNLAFILYKCGDDLKVLTLHQERAVILPGCDEELCPLHHFFKTYHDSIDNCKFSEICETAFAKPHFNLPKKN